MSFTKGVKMIRKKANFGKCLSILVNEVVPVVAGFDNKYVFISTNHHLTFNRKKKKKNLRPHRDVSTHMYTHLFLMMMMMLLIISSGSVTLNVN